MSLLIIYLFANFVLFIEGWGFFQQNIGGRLVNLGGISSTVAAADYHQIRDADWSIQIFF